MLAVAALVLESHLRMQHQQAVLVVRVQATSQQSLRVALQEQTRLAALVVLVRRTSVRVEEAVAGVLVGQPRRAGMAASQAVELVEEERH